MPKKTGWLIKEGGGWRSWKRRWFVLEGSKLSYYGKEHDEKTLKGFLTLENAGHIRAVELPKQKNKLCFQIQTPSRTYFMASETDEDRQGWLDVLNATLQDLQPKKPQQTKVGVDDFELLKLVGKGSFGKVMQVRLKSTGEVYAMKVLSKKHIVDHNEVAHTLSERSILQKLHHPFLVNLHFSFQTEEELYFILDFVNGGELFYHLQREKKFPLERVKFYASEILLALEHLHNASVIYRDLKPENLLVTNEGHICMTDFGLCKEGLGSKDARTETFCGTPEYLAPEVLLCNGYTKAVDWWSFGSLIFEMLTGLPPFYSSDVQEMYRRIMNDKLVFPATIDPTTQDLITQLLERDPNKRLAEPNAIKAHPFFEGVNWDLLFQKKIQPPYIPPVKNSLDISQIDPTFTEEKPTVTVNDAGGSIPSQAQKDFVNFTYVAPNNAAAAAVPPAPATTPGRK